LARGRGLNVSVAVKSGWRDASVLLTAVRVLNHEKEKMTLHPFKSKRSFAWTRAKGTVMVPVTDQLLEVVKRKEELVKYWGWGRGGGACNTSRNHCSCGYFGRKVTPGSLGTDRRGTGPFVPRWSEEPVR